LIREGRHNAVDDFANGYGNLARPSWKADKDPSVSRYADAGPKVRAFGDELKGGLREIFDNGIFGFRISAAAKSQGDDEEI
jgi:hypothetical protein